MCGVGTTAGDARLSQAADRVAVVLERTLYTNSVALEEDVRVDAIFEDMVKALGLPERSPCIRPPTMRLET